MYRKHIWKWWLLKRNRKNCPEVAVNEQFLHGKSKLFLNCLKNHFFKFAEKNRNLKKIAFKNRNFQKICLEKSKFFVKLPEKSKFLRNLPGKIEILLTRINDPPDFKPDWRRWYWLTGRYCHVLVCRHNLLHSQFCAIILSSKSVKYLKTTGTNSSSSCWWLLICYEYELAEDHRQIQRRNPAVPHPVWIKILLYPSPTKIIIVRHWKDIKLRP